MPRKSPITSNKLQYEEASSTVTYIGEAAPKVLASEASWRIKRITYTGNNFVVEWADGNAEFDNNWNNRASLTYS